VSQTRCACAHVFRMIDWVCSPTVTSQHYINPVHPRMSPDVNREGFEIASAGAVRFGPVPCLEGPVPSWVPPNDPRNPTNPPNVFL
jgi:hypothetical protein